MYKNYIKRGRRKHFMVIQRHVEVHMHDTLNVYLKKLFKTELWVSICTLIDGENAK